MTCASIQDQMLCLWDDAFPRGGLLSSFFVVRGTRPKHRDEPHKLVQPGVTPGPATILPAAGHAIESPVPTARLAAAPPLPT
jgi:hypothetical protein